MADEEARLELAQKSYDEVLDATKHQDDKIGRFLTAIAFLFTGAIAFGARSEIVGARVDIGDDPISLPAVFLGLFLLLAIISVLLLLVALGPNLNLPSPERDGSEFEGKLRSRIYFLSMDRMTADAWWKEQWVDNPPTAEDATRNYVYDAHNLATKTTFKSGRTNEADAAKALHLDRLDVGGISGRGRLGLSFLWGLGGLTLQRRVEGLGAMARPDDEGPGALRQLVVGVQPPDDDALEYVVHRFNEGISNPG